MVLKSFCCFMNSPSSQDKDCPAYSTEAMVLPNDQLKGLCAGILLFVAVTTPSLGMAFGAGSMAAGLLLVSVLFVFLFLALCAKANKAQRPVKGLAAAALVLVVGLLLFILFQGMLSFTANDFFDAERFLLTFIFLVVFLLGASSLAQLAQMLTRRQTDIAVRLVFFALVLMAILAIAGYDPFFGRQKSIIFFVEPSHFALDFLPFLLYMAVQSPPKKKFVLIFVGALIALLLQNLTLVVGITLIAICTIRLRPLLYAVFIAMLLQVIFKPVDISYYSDRLNFSKEKTNLSTLVYMQGWERAYLNFKETCGLGVGFQQFGIVGSHGEVMKDVIRAGGSPLCIFGGGTVGAKLVGELGIVGLTILLAYLVYFVKIVKYLRKNSCKGLVQGDFTKTFFLSCFVSFFVDFFIRGTGYFSSTAFLFVAALFLFPGLSKIDG